MMNAENMLDAEQKRLAWRCRRGLLELDIVLQRFVKDEFNQLSLGELRVFDAMLELPDNDFWDYINGTNTAKKDADMTAVITKIKAAQFNHQEAD
ncbi:MAG TPA: succinate dehydrogenase assembly factor 2 [Methylotenera sp.]|nr:succinate dehydrogenase assembly factor 2 [Methylotenera sp.]HPH05213.1 succinate dehydrogenase assembly factor 2 [Methylotenera sp.]HPN00115.1 succinate dehydrogenase assembly factor 2 [Methylotenera sp.]